VKNADILEIDFSLLDSHKDIRSALCKKSELQSYAIEFVFASFF
jgi:hypothetical protein